MGPASVDVGIDAAAEPFIDDVGFGKRESLDVLVAYLLGAGRQNWLKHTQQASNITPGVAFVQRYFSVAIGR
jgi:hypothetical protein